MHRMGWVYGKKNKIFMKEMTKISQITHWLQSDFRIFAAVCHIKVVLEGCILAFCEEKKAYNCNTHMWDNWAPDLKVGDIRRLGEWELTFVNCKWTG
jgi:hypothetical protein